MKVIVWLWPVLTLIYSYKFVCVCAQQEFQNYADIPSDNNYIQDYLVERNKRSKSSLSIVNPIDVLRQRLLLEIARRQMKQNSKQVALNRAYLKNIGKRGTIHKTQKHLQPDNYQYSTEQDNIQGVRVPLSTISLAENHRQKQQNRNMDQLQIQNDNLNNKLFDLWRQNVDENKFGAMNDDGSNHDRITMNDEKVNFDMSDNEMNDNNIDNDDDYQIKYRYRLQKKQFSRE